MNEAKKSARVLVVDDEYRNRRLLVAMLEAEGYTALEAADGAQALERARQSPPDLVLLDIMMPGLDGYEVARALKADAATKAIPVVMVTALDDRESRLRGLEAGAEEFVTKPVDRSELCIRVRNLLRLKELRDHLEQLVAERTAKLEAEIVERKRIEKEQARLVAIIEATPDLVGTADLAGRPLFVNQAGLQMLGFEPGQELSAVRILETHPEWAGKVVAGTAIPHAIEHGSWSGETALLRRNGREIPVSQVIIAHRGASGSVEYLSTIARDITQRKEQENRITRLNRVYAVLSGINTTIVRTRDRQELFDEACRIAVEHGRFRFAWIGLLDPNGTGIMPVAKAGIDEGYLDGLRLSKLDDSPDTLTLVRRAVGDKAAIVCNDIDADPRMARWREAALRRGYRSVVVFPLQVAENVLGVLLLYAAEADFFDTEEMRLLTELAGDVSFALDHLGKQERLDYLAYYDVLTGLPNRTLLHDRLEQRVAAGHRDGMAFAVIMLNLERFRQVNETLGQHAGDELLRQLARRLRDGLEEGDIVGRLGGDSFAIVTSHAGNEVVVAHVLEQVVSRLHGRPYSVEGSELHLAVRAGVAIFPSDGGDADTLYRNAEAALERARRSGDRYLFYAPEFNARVADKLTLENNLRRALERGELFFHFQPKVEIGSRRIVGLEALMRWRGPDNALISPARFVPVLEETGMILEAGRQALQTASTVYREWKARGLDAPRIAVNVSVLQLRRHSFVADVRAALGEPDNGVDLEITESLLMEDIEESIRKLRALRETGARIALDDFGTGHSSLAYLSQLPIDTVKIDRSFVHGMTESADHTSIVSTIISLAQALRLNIVAEGVETEEQARLLLLLRCDQMQGYLFSRPLPKEEIEALLRTPTA